MTDRSRPLYPFTALVGQEAMKRALLLHAINPRLGGVLIRGQKGTAKSTAVRALAALLPEIDVVADCPFQCDPSGDGPRCDACAARAEAGPLPVRRRRVPLVDLPLGATEDRVVGTLDLERALQYGERRFEPGLLASANRGILYVDEVNLLGDHLVDVLLDAAALGMNYVEREGLSFSHPAQFVLVGTMNPEEGDLRPQLLDRFALAVEVEGLPAPADRAEVVRRRIAFEADPVAFAARWAEAEAAERERLQRARERLPRVRLEDNLLDLITRLCAAFEVDGLRADIVMYKAAITLAAYADRTLVTEEDVRQAAELALPHRRRRQPFEQPGLDRERLERAIQEHRREQQHPPGADGGGGNAANDPAGGWWGEREQDAPDSSGQAGPEQVEAPGTPFPVQLLARPAARPLAAQAPAGRSQRVRAPGIRGAYVGSVLPRGPLRDLALDATLRAAAPEQLARRAASARASTPTRLAWDPASPRLVHLERRDLRQKVRETRAGSAVLFVVDASGSMAAQRRMAAVKGAILSLLLEAYQRRDQVGLIAFRSSGADLLLPLTGSVDRAEAHLRRLPTGGRTPLAHGLALAAATLRRQHLAGATTRPLLVLVTDGRANVPLASDDPLQDARQQALALAAQRVPAIVVDTERGAGGLGLARELAAHLRAHYVCLDELSAEHLVHVVRAR